MEAEKIEKMFWFLLFAWFVLRCTLLGSQYLGDTDPTVKNEVLKYFSQADIDAGRKYAMSGFWFKSVYGALYVFVLVAMLKYGAFAWLWQKISAMTGTGLFKNDLVFTIVFFLFLELLSLPSSFYFGYLREAESGFANIGFWGWLFKFAKSVAVSMTVETAGVLLLIAVLRWFPVRWPLLVPLIMGLFSLAVTLLFPVLITPLFYNQQPLASGELRNRLLDLAKKSGMEVSEIYVIDESRYSKHTNAYFTGIGGHRRIVLYDNLITSHTEDEALLIFAHEAGHWKHNHVAWGLSLGVMAMLAIALLWHFLFPLLSQVGWFGLENISSAANIPFLVIVVILMQLFTSPIESQISQFMEKQADLAALELTGLSDAYIAAQVRLSRDNRSELLPAPFRVFWLYSHPPALQRIKMAKASDTWVQFK